MRFFADESCDFRVVRDLRAAGHDVTTVTQSGGSCISRGPKGERRPPT
jgi:Domain of unknown function (DUF5615)